MANTERVWLRGGPPKAEIDSVVLPEGEDVYGYVQMLEDSTLDKPQRWMFSYRRRKDWGKYYGLALFEVCDSVDYEKRVSERVYWQDPLRNQAP